MVRMRSIIRVFLLAALIMFLTGVHIFADTTELTTVVTKETSGIFRIRQFYRQDPDHSSLYSSTPGETLPNPEAPQIGGGTIISIDLAGNGGHALIDKTLISTTGGFGLSCSVGVHTTSASCTVGMALGGAPIITGWTLDATGKYIESFTISNRIDDTGLWGSVNVTVIEYN